MNALRRDRRRRVAILCQPDRPPLDMGPPVHTGRYLGRQPTRAASRRHLETPRPPRGPPRKKIPASHAVRVLLITCGWNGPHYSTATLVVKPLKNFFFVPNVDRDRHTARRCAEPEARAARRARVRARSSSAPSPRPRCAPPIAPGRAARWGPGAPSRTDPSNRSRFGLRASAAFAGSHSAFACAESKRTPPSPGCRRALCLAAPLLDSRGGAGP